MTARKAISKRVRFEVLKRDAFTCQYCGKSAPDVILHLDHIKPVSKGGSNGIMNLVTSCQSCNSGKSDVELSDDSAIKKQQKQLADMAEKREQIKLMIEWRESIEDSEELLVQSVANLITTLMVDKSPNEHGTMLIRKAVKKHGYQAVFDSVNETYSKSESIADFISKWSKSFQYIGLVQSESKKKVSYAKGILRNRFNYFNEKRFHVETASVKLEESDFDSFIDAAKKCKSVGDFYLYVEGFTNG